MRFLLTLFVFITIFGFSTAEIYQIRQKRQWGFGYPLFGGPGNSWEVPSNIPYHPGYDAWAGR